MTTTFIVRVITVIAVVCNIYIVICADKLIIETNNVNVRIATFIYVHVMETSNTTLVIVIAAACDVDIARGDKFMNNTNNYVNNVFNAIHIFTSIVMKMMHVDDGHRMMLVF